MDEQDVKIYLKSLDISNTITERILKIYEICKILCPEEILDILIEDTIKEDGSRLCEAVNFFSNHYVLGEHLILNDGISVLSIAKRISSFKIEYKDYDFKEPSSDSRLNVHIVMMHVEKWSLKASAENCNNLKIIFEKYIIPNMTVL